MVTTGANCVNFSRQKHPEPVGMVKPWVYLSLWYLQRLNLAHDSMPEHLVLDRLAKYVLSQRGLSSQS